MKKLLLLNLIFLFASTSLFSQTATAPTSGDGSAGNPYQIANLENLYWIASNSANWGFHYIQTANIDASTTSGWFGGAGWTPIGNYDNHFTGSYDGKGFILENIFINRPPELDIGLFGYIGIEGVVRNLGLINLDIVGLDYCGGLTGNNEGSVDNCYSTGMVSGSSNTGGLIGESFDGNVTRSYSSATVSGTSYVGGFIGKNSSIVNNCYSFGDVTATVDNIGGFIGSNSNSVSNSYSHGNASTSGDIVGGFIGTNSSSVSNSYSLGSAIAGSRKRNFGGFCGSNSGLISLSFWDLNTSGLSTSAGGTGLTTAEMHDKLTFTNAGWDFIETWAIHSSANGGYPLLPLWVKWEGGSADWGIGTNWSKGSVPGSSDYISITSKANNPQISGATSVNYVVVADGAELTIQSGGGLTINSGGRLTLSPGALMTAVGSLTNSAGTDGLLIESGTGSTGSLIHNSTGVDATVQRYVTGSVWQILSPPVSGMTVGSFITNSNNDISYNSGLEAHAMAHFDEGLLPGGGWAPYYKLGDHSRVIESGRSYIVRRRSNGVLTFTGTLVTTQSYSIQRVTNGWNSIGNPYASALKVKGTADGFLFTNASNLEPEYAALYVYDPDYPTAYRIINNNGADLGTKYIQQDYLQSGQGFLVKAPVNGSTVSFDGMKSHQPATTYFKNTSSGPWPTVILNVSTASKEATTVVTFHENMTRGLDVTYDAGLYGGDPELKVYTKLVEGDETVNFAIQCLPDEGFEDIVIPLGLDFTTGGEVKFSTDILTLPIGARAVLEDRLLNIFTDLEVEDYIVTLDENTAGSGRFFIHTDYRITSVEDEIEEAGKEEFEIYSFGKEIFILGEITGVNHASLFDLTGKTVRTVRLENSTRNSFRVDDLSRGIYLIRVSGNTGNKAKRVFIE